MYIARINAILVNSDLVREFDLNIQIFVVLTSFICRVHGWATLRWAWNAGGIHNIF